LDFCWQTDSDLHGSDHYPIVITTDTPSPFFSKPTWKLHKADCAAFSHQAALELCTDTICSAEDPIQQFTDVVINIANNSIPKGKPNIKKHDTIRCNEDCKSVIKTRNKALKWVQKHPTQQNIENYRVIRAKTRRVIKTLNASPGEHTSPKSTVVPLRRKSGQWSVKLQENHLPAILST